MKRWLGIIAALLAAVPGFSQNCWNRDRQSKQSQCNEKESEPRKAAEVPAAYNAPARIDVSGTWDFFITGSFIYWQPQQENMELGIANTSSNVLSGRYIDLDFDYKPGFKVGVGSYVNRDDWDLYVEYTRVHGSHHTSVERPPGGSIAPAWGHPSLILVGGASELYSTASERWRLNMDFLDAELGRSYRLGTQLDLRPFFGLRGAWIRQELNVQYFNNVITTVGPIGADFGTDVLLERTRCWGVGPRVGLDSNWMLGCGLRLYGNTSVDLLHTRYTEAVYDETFTSIDSDVFFFRTRQKEIRCLRPHLDLELGMGWGSYFSDEAWHLDLALGYGFQVFFNQNMFRHFEDDVGLATSTASHGDLFVEGLTASLRLDF